MQSRHDNRFGMLSNSRDVVSSGTSKLKIRSGASISDKKGAKER
jgi:hypothetical protein